jgi:tetratricopeptide (TPR) repeat protein
LGEVGSNFEDIAVKSANIDGIDPVFVNQFAQSGIGVLEKVTTKEDTIPYYWLKLASLYYLEAYSSQGNIGESLNQAHNAVLKTQELVPNRVEAMILDAKIKLAQNQISEAESIMGEVMAIVPKDPSSQWHFKYKKDALAVYDLLIRYYAAKEDYSRVLDLYLKEVSLDPNNFQLYSGLAATYAKLGQKDKAIEAANKVVELEPAAREDTQKFIESLK